MIIKVNKIKQKLSLFLLGFYIVCDESNNTEEIAKREELIIDLYFKPNLKKLKGLNSYVINKFIIGDK